ncbi:hypothetical protein M422DRAFT_253735 [Sphaerobolus stellatus SS14]|uniref:Uncharacterized protein n=1 Tax=Sphaerobolus stellatus (strain SS14) TaxID=990650 RepID=A0A0C9VX51_SPHS4|nr:hypothetical protein M422DRAFT_258042 [Sphaerobolus stellatus SS14]KIJ42946.1 hypothetical protein M422DRAFT_253735 [Sphaerobolus stellatus SS14]
MLCKKAPPSSTYVAAASVCTPSKGLLDDELFVKRNGSILREREADESSSKGPWFILFKSITVMEGWYLSLFATYRKWPAPYPLDGHASLIASSTPCPTSSLPAG